MNHQFHFTFSNIEEQYRAALESGYQFLTCQDFLNSKNNLPNLAVVNRVDIDLSVAKADKLRDIFDRLGIKASFFVRLHEARYNPFSFENYRILKAIRESGHEIGYHSEIIDQSVIWNEDPSDCLKRDLKILNTMLNINIQGIASHGGLTGLNNLDFWTNNEVSAFGVKYEAYDNSHAFNLFNSSFYISDSEWTQWKCYEQGVLCKDDRRSFREHLSDKHPLIYLLIHPETYSERHPYDLTI